MKPVVISLSVRCEAENWWWHHNEHHQCSICHTSRNDSCKITSDISSDFTQRFIIIQLPVYHGSPDLQPHDRLIAEESRECEQDALRQHGVIQEERDAVIVHAWRGRLHRVPDPSNTVHACRFNVRILAECIALNVLANECVNESLQSIDLIWEIRVHL